MRKIVNWLVIPAFVLGVLVFASGGTALADGGRHGGHGHHGGYYDHHRHHHHYRPPVYPGGACYPPRYPAYSVRAYRVVPPYAVPRNYYGGQTGFYSRGPNYSFGINYGW